MTEITAELTAELQEKEQAGIEIEYYTLDGQKPKIHMCPGDLQVICNVMHDYSALLEESLKDKSGMEGAIYKIHSLRCKKIQRIIEQALGYDVEKTIEKCRKKRGKKEDDIGEDALILAARKRREKE